jgi:hypothetical protein
MNYSYMYACISECGIYVGGERMWGMFKGEIFLVTNIWLSKKLNLVLAHRD